MRQLGGFMWACQLLVVIGAINWGLIGFFGLDLVAALFGGPDAFLSRAVYALVGIAGVIAATLLFQGERRTAPAGTEGR